MTRAHLIYPLDKRISSELKKTESDPFNRDIIVRFYKARSCELTKASMLIYIIRLNQMSRILKKKFEDATIEDIENLVFEITNMKVAESTKNRIRKVLKGFYRWMKRLPRGQFPPEVSWIITKKSNVITVKPDDLIPFEECVKISESATNLRDKALLQCQLDAGCRIGEILTVRVGEVKFNDYGAVLNSDGKTGEAPLILTWSSKTLAQWLNLHPFKNDSTAPVFCKLESPIPSQLTHSAALAMLRKCLKRAGYKEKRVWFHLFKHISCTWDSVRGMPQSYRNFKHHWSPNSDMNRIYEHLSNSVIPLIQTWNTKGEKKLNEKTNETTDLKLIETCKRCEYENPRDSKFCNRCTFPLVNVEQEIERKTRVEELLYDIINNPDQLEKLREFLSASYHRKA